MKKLIIIYTGLLICACLAGCTKNDNSEAFSLESVIESQSTLSTDKKQICVYIVGEIVNPGVYTLDEDSRVCDVVALAGGFTEYAAKEYINLAGRLSDEQQVIVYSLEEVKDKDISIMEEDNSRININTATKEMLMTLPGIGESRAMDIISYREENGGFSAIEDIMKISGIKEAAFSKIKDLITVG